jgi:3-dehydroquinate synthase
MTASAKTVTVDLAQRAYDVVVGPGVLTSIGERVRRLLPHVRRALIVADDNVPHHFATFATNSLEAESIDATTFPAHASEKRKSLRTVEAILNDAALRRLERTDVIVALGGGVIGDLAGFAAATFKRGVAVVQCPTTLLAMVDASVGGKTGVNLLVPDAEGRPTLLKNMAGAFWQPSLVLADLDTLKSLPMREFRAGLAECIKHSLLAGKSDPDLASFTQDRLASVLDLDTVALAELIRRNVAVKAGIVVADEREEAASADGGRAVLNLGHTFAHAIEGVHTAHPSGQPELAPLLHGEAVALGLVAAARMSEALDFFSGPTADTVEQLVADAGLPIRCAGIPDNETILRTMRHDKKARSGEVRFIVPVAHGECRVIADPPTGAVIAGLNAIRA